MFCKTANYWERSSFLQIRIIPELKKILKSILKNTEYDIFYFCQLFDTKLKLLIKAKGKIEQILVESQVNKQNPLVLKISCGNFSYMFYARSSSSIEKSRQLSLPVNQM